MSNEIRVRFAPSPTGYLHVGSLRTALYNYLYAKKVGGKFILRIEDTDQTRYVNGAVKNLLETLESMGLEYDEGPEKGGEYGPYFQSKRTEIYNKYVKELLDHGKAYRCFCTPDELDKKREEHRVKGLDTRYDGRCRKLNESEINDHLGNNDKFVIRLKIPQEGEVTFYDIVREKVTFPWNMVDDQVLVKSDGFPTYHLANVIDDHLMEISHVIRGEEWLSSVPKHLCLYEALGWKPPKMCHLPLLLNSDKSKLSKRQGDVAVEDFLNKGYLPETLLNFVVLLGWHAPGDQEFYTLTELEKAFSLKRINKSGSVFDLEKLNWMNGQYLRNTDLKVIGEYARKYFIDAGYHITNEKHYLELVDIARNRIHKLDEVTEFAKPFFSKLEYAEEDKAILGSESSQILFKFWVDNIIDSPELNEEFINGLLNRSVEELGIKGKELYPPLRLALYGSEHGPELPTIMDILEKEKVLLRFKNVLK
ncbi:MAG: glutamate--tRNA ligase [Candidatus Cloacimonetes bacterium]|jgi:nondiscriminating glutamyl-tRNA synthetase|nr:glutamate--tRNA ligase [Candidatus Cloacimonadota bacterium]